ncbi:glycosyltransferase [Nostoc sp. LEGE 12447]|uniref:glycosyltransferase n=1 Tax=Nostoc sp. LEGE 12447 TaxID=1828640 RepID=UPI00188446A3|nr:glycosyltransferase [Nostoc sp. LEGE 12447]MBE9001110.1 glycosyltransferase [Nostoc sp. LEGE 12447]
MTHFAIVCPAGTGHLNPMFALGRELKRRGHRVTFIEVLDAQATTRAAGLEFQAIAESEYPLGAMPKLFARIDREACISSRGYFFNTKQPKITFFLNRFRSPN